MDEEVSEVDSFFTEAEIEECCRGTSVWICPVCHKSLSRKQTLKAHLNSVHSVRAGTASKRYKLYDYCPTARIPRSTQSRWNLKEKEVEQEKDCAENETIMTPSSTQSMYGCDHSLISNQDAAISSCKDKEEEDRPVFSNQNVPGYDASNIIPTSASYQDGSETSAATVIQEELEENLHDNAISLADDGVSNSYYAEDKDAEGDNFLLVDMDCSDDCSDAESSSDESAVSSEEDPSLDNSSLLGPPLYVFPPSDTLQRSPISHQQHMLLLCAYAISQKLSGVAFQQLLNVIKLHLPENSICEGNVLELKEKLANEEIIFHDICRVCGALFKDVLMCRTPGCGARKITDTDRKRVCFATSNCEEQLRNILQRHGNFEKIQEEIEKRVTDADNACICDVTSGSMYKELCEPGNFLDNVNNTLNITLTWNTDGIPLFKSSSVSLWPVYLAINELPQKERFLKKNFVVWGIWQGDCKPSMNTFLSPFVKDMMKLYRTGFPVNGKICRAMLLLGSMDLQARAYAMNFVQHNGASSCLYCEEPGKVVTSGKGHCRCFPYSDEVTMRTKSSVCEAASEAVSSGKATHGFHGKSVLLCLPFFQPQQHIVIDYMHGVLLGINKKLFSLWFDAKFYKEVFFIGNQIEDIDHLLKRIRPPYLINRLPRKLKNNYHRWKASEIRSWFLFYSIPCLQGILPHTYLKHFACLVEGIHLLLMECISPQNLVRAKTLLHAFYKNSTDLYGENFAGLNVHNLWHYADCVKMWGPLWAWSCFGFESCNGEILQSVHGRGNVCTEIFWSLHAEKQIELGMKSMPKGQVKSYFQKVLLSSKRKPPKTAQAYQCEYIPPLQDLVVEDDLLRDMDVNKTEVTTATEASQAKVLKIVRHGFVFYSKACTRVRKRNSYTALLETPAADGGRAIIIDYFLVNKMTYCVFAVGHTMRVVGPALSRQCCHIQKVEQIRSCCIGESDLKTTTLRSTLGKNTLKGVWVFLALVGQVVAPAALSSGQITVQVVEEPTNRVLNEYDVFMIQILMSRSLTSLEQDVPQSWSKITSYEEVSSSLLTLQRKLQEHDVLLTLIVLDTLPEFLNDDLVQRAVLKAWTTLEDEEELLENHFEEKTSRNKHVVLTNGSFQSLLTQLKGEPFDSDEVHSQLHSADSPSKLVIIDGEPQVLRFQEFQILFGIYVQHTLLNQQQLMKRKPQLPRRANGQSGSSGADIRKEAAAKSKVVLTKDAFQSLLKQVKLDTLQDEDHEPSHSQDVEVSASKVGLSKGRTTSPLMLQKEFLSKLVSQTMNTLHRQSTLHDQLMFLDGALDQDLPESLEETESPSKLVTPVMYQREFLSKILSQTMNTIYGESGLQDKLKMWDAMLELAFRKRLENTESPSKLINPVMYQREFLSKILSQTMNTLYGDSGFLDQVELFDGVLAFAFQEHLAKTELPNKLTTPIMYQREFIAKILSQTMSTLYGESGLGDELNFFDRVLDKDLPESLEETESPSKPITPVMHQRELLSKELLLTMSTLYRESGLQDKLKVLDGEDLTSMEHPDKTESLSKYNTLVMHQREFLSKILSQTMSTLYGEAGLQDQLKVLDGEALASLERPDKTESPSKLISPVVHQRELLSKELFLTMSKLYVESGLQEKLRVFNGILDLASLDHPEKTESPSKFITPVMYERESLSKELLQTMSTLYGESGLQDQLKLLDGEDLTSMEHSDETESLSKLITLVMHQRETLSKELFLTMSTLYGESGLQDQLKVLDGEDLASLERPDKTESLSKVISPVVHQREFLGKELFLTMSTLYGESGLQDQLKLLDGEDLASLERRLNKSESPSKLISPVMYQREFLSKIPSQTMKTLYGESGLQDQLKMWDGVMDQTKYTVAASSQSFDGLKQDAWLSQEALRGGLRSAVGVKASACIISQGVRMFLVLVGQVVAPAALSRGQVTLQVVEEPTREGLSSAAVVKSSASCNYKETHQVVQLYTDSCYRRSGSFTQRMAGLGGLWYDKLKYHVFSTAYSNPHKLHNNDLEMLAILVALNLHGRDWQGMNVEAYCDNESTVKLLNAYCDDTSLNVLKCKSRNRKQRSSKIQTFIINEINEEVCRYKFRLSTIQIGGKQNCRADMLSRRGIEEFSSHLPRGARYCEYNVMAELHSFDRSLESWMKTF